MTRCHTLRTLVALSLITVLAASLGACKEDQASKEGSREDTPAAKAAAPATPKTVSYFLAHPEELQATWNRCRNDPGSLGRSSECVNVAEARKQRTANEMRDALK